MQSAYLTVTALNKHQYCTSAIVIDNYWVGRDCDSSTKVNPRERERSTLYLTVCRAVQRRLVQQINQLKKQGHIFHQFAYDHHFHEFAHCLSPIPPKIWTFINNMLHETHQSSQS